MTKTLSLRLPTASGTAFYAVTCAVDHKGLPLMADDGSLVGLDVAATDMSFRHRLARASYEQELRAHLAELGMSWESAVVARLTGKAAA